MATAFVDFKVVKAAVTFEQVLAHYNVTNLKRSKGELRGPCPIHKGDGGRTFHVSTIKRAFHCFSCGVRGNILDFVAAKEQCSIRDAALHLAEWFSIGTGESVGVSESTQPTSIVVADSEQTAAELPAIINPPLSFQLRVDHAHPYGAARGLLPETIAEFGSGLCTSKGTFAGRYLFPLHNTGGELVGYAGRSLDDTEPRYLFPSRERGFYKSGLLFNLHRVLEAQADRRRKGVVVVEGFVGCALVHQAGRGCVALMGSSLSEAQADLLAEHFAFVTLLLDGDGAGRFGTGAAAPLLLHRGCYVRWIELGDDESPDSCTLEELQSILAY